MIEQFFHKNISKINFFLRNGRNDPVVLSLILSEMYFNSHLKRQIEYIAFVFLRIIFKARINRLSIGIAQIQIRYWQQYNYIKDHNVILSLAIVSNDLNNYDLVKEIIKNRLVKPINYSKLLADYRGESRAYHLKTFLELKNYVTNYCGDAKDFKENVN